MSELSLQDKIPPQNLEMEQAVLGSILVSPTCIVEAMSVLGPNDFHRPAHTLLWQALTKMHSKSLPIDLLTVKQFLEERSHTDRYGEHHDFLDDCGGWEYIVRLTDAVPSAANIKHYCLSVREASVRRGIETVSRKMQQMAHDEGRPADSLMSYCFNELAGLAQRFARYGRAYSMEEAVRGLYDETEERYNTPQNERGTLGAPCGIQVVDYATNGWQPGDMIVLAARPSVGKTALGTQFAVNAALEGYPAVFFSYEMTERALTRRIVSNCARVDSRVIARATMNDDQWVQFRKSCERCSAMPLTIVDASGMTVPEMEVEIRRLPDTRLVVVDYCALIPSVEQYGNKDYLRVTEISHAIKAMAHRLNVPVILIAQLNRDVEKRKGGRPMLSDLSDSSALEKDADVVAFLWSDVEEPRPSQYEVSFSIAKQRNGPLCWIRLMYDAPTTRFYEDGQ